jgi:hypothetical protein
MVWAPEGMRPICKVTGSHDRTVIFVAVSIDGEQLFRQYETFDGENFLDFLKKVHKKFRICIFSWTGQSSTTGQERYDSTSKATGLRSGSGGSLLALQPLTWLRSAGDRWT